MPNQGGRIGEINYPRLGDCSVYPRQLVRFALLLILTFACLLALACTSTPSEASPDFDTSDSALNENSQPPPLRRARFTPPRIVADPRVVRPNAPILIGLQQPDGAGASAAATRLPPAVWLPELEPATILLTAARQGPPLDTAVLAILRLPDDAPLAERLAALPVWTAGPTGRVVVLSVSDIADRSRLMPDAAALLAASTARAFVAIVTAPEQPGEYTIALGPARLPIRVATRGATGGVRPPQAGAAALADAAARMTPAQRDALLAKLQPLLDDPLRRWRLDLIDRHRPDLLGLTLADALSRARQGDSPAARLVHQAVSDQWSVGLDRLAAADAELAADVLARLIAVAKLPTGQFVPAWPIDRDADFDLLRVLTLASARPVRVRERAETYLRVLPPLGLVVVDDAGDSYRPGRPREEQGPIEPGFDPDRTEFSLVRPAPSRVVRGLTVAITDLAAKPAYASLSSPGLSGSKGFNLRPLDSQIVDMDAASLAEARAAFVEASVGRDSVRRSTPARPVAATRPALKLGPFAEQLVMLSWLGERNIFPPRPWWTAAQLARRHDGQWELFIEARRPAQFLAAPNANSNTTPNADPNATPNERPTAAPQPGRWADDRIELWFGPFASDAEPDLVVPAPPAGVADAFDDPRGFRVARAADADRWTATVRLPASLTDRDEILLGMVRRDPRRAATAWPRPMMPDQIVPGRRRIDLTQWPTLDDELESTGRYWRASPFSVTDAATDSDAAE